MSKLLSDFQLTIRWSEASTTPWTCFGTLSKTVWAGVCREGLLSKGIAPVLKARSAETWVEWALPGTPWSAREL